jgi:predicted ribosome-associated RNA-binding protein Tma20
LIKQGYQIDIESLNYILGLSKKSIEIQKKNRSEFLNKLNQKIKEVLSTEENIIIRVKDEEDKRVFVYQLNPIFFTQVQELL